MDLGLMALMGGGFVGAYVIALRFVTAERSIHDKFLRLGSLNGLTRAEVVAAIGPPNSITEAGAGKKLLQWTKNSSRGGFHVALLFGPDDVFERITHQHAS
jgi:hypothetical protein